MFRYTLFLCLIFSSTHIVAQRKVVATSAELHIGDQMPDVFIPHISQYPKTSARVSNFRGKWVILDFWWTGCGGCIAKFPEMKRLSDLYKDKLQIVLVNFEAKKNIDIAFARMSKRESIYKMVDLPLVTSDTIFEKLFPHTLVPHEVWIDDKGIVRAITEAYEVNAENIEHMLNDKNAQLPVKKDFLAYDPFQPVLPQIFALDPSVIQYSSTILKYFSGLRGPTERRHIDSVNGTIRITRGNNNLMELIGEAVLKREPTYNTDLLKSSDYDFGKRVVIETHDSSRYIFKKSDHQTRDDWDHKNRFSYEAILPLTIEDSLYSIMLETICHYFQLRIYVEKRTMPVLALIRTSPIDKIKANGYLVDSLVDLKKTQLYNVEMSELRDAISEGNKKTPYIFRDDTGYTGRITVEFAAPLSDLEAFKKELHQKYDLDIVERNESMDVLVIKE